jgi:hypothetical protein
MYLLKATPIPTNPPITAMQECILGSKMMFSAATLKTMELITTQPTVCWKLIKTTTANIAIIQSSGNVLVKAVATKKRTKTPPQLCHGGGLSTYLITKVQ